MFKHLTVFLLSLIISCQALSSIELSNSIKGNQVFFNDGSKFLKINHKTVQIWEVEKNILLKSFDATNEISFVEISKKDNIIVVFTKEAVSVWDSQELSIILQNQWSSQTVNTLWINQTHLIVNCKTQQNNYFYRILNTQNLRVQRWGHLQIPNYVSFIKQSCIVGNTIIIQSSNSSNIYAYALNHGILQQIQVFQNSSSVTCSENMLFSLERKGLIIKKYDQNLKIISENSLQEPISEIFVQDSSIIGVTNNQIIEFSSNFHILDKRQSDSSIKKILKIDEFIVVLFVSGQVQKYFFQKYIPELRIMQDTGQNGTGLATITPPDKGFIAAMVVCIGIITILFIIFAVIFCCKKNQLSGNTQPVDTQEKLEAGN